jgi:hypothetical protein
MGRAKKVKMWAAALVDGTVFLAAVLVMWAVVFFCGN